MNIFELHALLILDKPAGLTSRAAVDRALAWFPRGTRLGHTGTLDPLATGVLVLCAGQATRLAEYIQRMPKTYRTTFLLGRRSTTDDADGDIDPVAVEKLPDQSAVRQALASFMGTIEQVPPAFSAAKVFGRRAYDVARAGRHVALAPRKVQIHEIHLHRYTYPLLELDVRCGKGTYIRSLARDLGRCLGCGALVQVLRRLRVGPFAVEDAITLDTDAATARGRLLPIEAAVADLPRLALPQAELDRLRHGQAIRLGESAGSWTVGQELAVFDTEGRLAAVGTVDDRAQVLRPEKVLAVRPRP